jgi:hypothetical protein
MNLLTTFILAIREVRRHLLRSFLTTLGIVIGVGTPPGLPATVENPGQFVSENCVKPA